MIQVLENFEYNFPSVEETQDGQVFKGNIRNAFNDVLRAQRDELRDYEVDYRPLSVSSDSISITRAFLQAVQKIDFGVSQDIFPHFKLTASSEHLKELDALRYELEAGIIYSEQNKLVLEVVGLIDCVNKVIPVLDKYKMHPTVRETYQEWRQKVVSLYIHSVL